MITPFAKAVDMSEKGVKSAVSMVNKMTGVPTDKTVLNYERLTSDDFDELRQNFGDEVTFDYIKKMEIRRTKV